MNELQHCIVLIFNQDRDSVFSTSQIVDALYPQDMEDIALALTSTDLRVRRTAQRAKAKLHRKVLYHIHQLVEQQVLCVAHIQRRGELCFALTRSVKQCLTVLDDFFEGNQDLRVLPSLVLVCQRHSKDQSGALVTALDIVLRLPLLKEKLINRTSSAARS